MALHPSSHHNSKNKPSIETNPLSTQLGKENLCTFYSCLKIKSGVTSVCCKNVIWFGET